MLDPKIHDMQHWSASLAGGVLGLGIFLTYYFFSRIEREEENAWAMPWWYFVVGILLTVCTGMALACTLSTAIRPR
jgi:hypothetical protein